jgi:acyl-CoA thioesterase
MAALDDTKSQITELLEVLSPEARAVALDALQHLKDRDRIAGPFGWLIGYHYTSHTAGASDCEIEITASHLNPGKIAHGGVIYTLADAAMGAAVMAMLEPGKRCVTAELKVNYLKPVAAGRVRAHASVLRLGSRLATVTAELRDDEEDIVAVALGTFAILSRQFTAEAIGK